LGRRTQLPVLAPRHRVKRNRPGADVTTHPPKAARPLDELKLATSSDAEALVFGCSGESPFVPTATGKRAKRCWKAAKLEPITLHECRHTFASLLIDSGANPKAVREFTGHSKIQSTFDTYGRLMPGSHDEVRERMDAYLARPSLPRIVAFQPQAL
jgi:integrase